MTASPCKPEGRAASRGRAESQKDGPKAAQRGGKRRKARAARRSRAEIAQEAQRRSKGLGGFSLIELLAVVAIFALIAGIALPNFGLLGSRDLESAAELLRDELEFARQRAIMTSRPHRVVLDLDQQAHWIEGLSAAEADPAEGAAAPEAGDPAAAEPAGRAPLSLAPPQRTEGEFQALPGGFGRERPLPGDVAFAGVETEEGVAEQGVVPVAFRPDGTTSWTQILLDDESGRSRTLEVLPLADVVRILDEPR
jgi:prepilin-type N-terminal cleavage/methylation domain-containing protein